MRQSCFQMGKNQPMLTALFVLITENRHYMLSYINPQVDYPNQGAREDTASNTNITDTNSAEKTMAQGNIDNPMEVDNDVNFNSKDTNSVTNVVEGRADKSSEKASEKVPEDQTVVQDLPPSSSELTLCGHPRRRQIGLTSVRELQEEITSNTHEGKVGKAH